MIGICYHWEAVLGCGTRKARREAHWALPPVGVLKFNVDGLARGKPGPISIGSLLWNAKGGVFLLLSKNVEIKLSDEAEVLAILEAF